VRTIVLSVEMMVYAPRAPQASVIKLYDAVSRDIEMQLVDDNEVPFEMPDGTKRTFYMCHYKKHPDDTPHVLQPYVAVDDILKQ
jgi:hypothetical protein